MNVIELSQHAILQPELLAKVVNTWYARVLDDYRIKRFFYTRPIEEQTQPLIAYLQATLIDKSVSQEKLTELLDEYFMVAFARGNAKHSLVTGRDFAFLLDIVGGPEKPIPQLLCDAHSHLLKLEPDDENYDVVLEHLVETCNQLALSAEQKSFILNFAEHARDGVLGRASLVLQAA